MQDENKREYFTYGDPEYLKFLDTANTPIIALHSKPQAVDNRVKYKVTVEKIVPRYSYFILFKLKGTSVPIVTKSRFWGTEDFLSGLREAEVNIEWSKVIEETKTKEEDRQ